MARFLADHGESQQPELSIVEGPGPVRTEASASVMVTAAVGLSREGFGGVAAPSAFVLVLHENLSVCGQRISIYI
jgi:hypothetical protein